MINKIDGFCFKNMLDYGARNLSINKRALNKINVFPVPDGDTGTNMVITVKNAVAAVENMPNSLCDISKKFSKAVVFGARGNSGVIVSHFLKGICDCFSDSEFADAALFVKALDNGVKCAYKAVSNPVEGTMLTVIKDASLAVNELSFLDKGIDEIVGAFVKYAKESLMLTPSILSVLSDAGVVDSGGAGIVCFFEGVMKYLDGEVIEDWEEVVAETASNIDYSKFNSDSVFQYGYCTEFLLQLLNSGDKFDYEEFKKTLNSYGNSIITFFDGDKVKLHIHTGHPELVMQYLHGFGEFLTIKIENMTVQHTEIAENIMISDNKSTGEFSILAVSFDKSAQKLFVDMGADAVICAQDGVSVQDYLEAFDRLETRNILVFPNSSEAVLTAIQAKKLHDKASVTVLPTRNVAECYAALPMIDFEEENIQNIVDVVMSTINKIIVVPVSFSEVVTGKELSKRDIDSAFAERVAKTIGNVVKKHKNDVVTIFYGKRVNQRHLDEISGCCKTLGISAELFYVYCDSSSRDILLSFE